MTDVVHFLLWTKLMLTIFDETQQFGGDREVTTVAMLPPTCLVVWMGDAQQTPGGIAKGDDQFALRESTATSQLGQRVMHSSGVQFWKFTEQGLRDNLRWALKGGRIYSMCQGTYAELHCCCNCMVNHSLHVVNILLQHSMALSDQ